MVEEGVLCPDLRASLFPSTCVGPHMLEIYLAPPELTAPANHERVIAAEKEDEFATSFVAGTFPCG